MKSGHSGPSLPVERCHDPSHFQGGLGGLQAAVMIFIEAADFSLLTVFEQQNLVDDRDFGFHLDQRKRLAHSLADMLRMSGLTAEDDPKADDRGITGGLAAGEASGDHGNFVRARHADDTHFGGTGVF